MEAILKSPSLGRVGRPAPVIVQAVHLILGASTQDGWQSRMAVRRPQELIDIVGHGRMSLDV